MSFGPCPVIKIKADNEGGYVVINLDDFDAAKGHEAYEGEGAPDFVQEPHITQAIADKDSGEASLAGVKAAQEAQGAWAAPTADAPAAPPVEPIEAPVAAPVAPAKAK